MTDVLWHVQDGKMMSGYILADFTFTISSYSDTFTKYNAARDMFSSTSLSDGTLAKYIDRGGKWYLLTGMQIVHEDDAYYSKETAANAYHRYLLGDEC